MCARAHVLMHVREHDVEAGTGSVCAKRSIPRLQLTAHPAAPTTEQERVWADTAPNAPGDGAQKGGWMGYLLTAWVAMKRAVPDPGQRGNRNTHCLTC